MAGYLVLPVDDGELQSMLRAVLAMRHEGTGRSIVTRHSLRAARRRLRVLVTDDNKVNQVLTTRLLERRGHVPEVAGDGLEALARLAGGQYDLVLMDVQMPQMSGLEATRALRAMEQATGRGRMPVVAMTAHVMAGEIEACRAAGMDGYVAKPIDPAVLFEQIEAVLAAAAAAAAPEPTATSA